MPQELDYDAYEQWLAKGSKAIATRAREKALEMLAKYIQPPLDQIRREELDDFVDRRKREIA